MARQSTGSGFRWRWTAIPPWSEHSNPPIRIPTPVRSLAGPARAYIYTRDPDTDVWTQMAKLTASDGAAGDEFGISVAVDGDTLVIGARGTDSDKGAIYVFNKPATGWPSNTTEATKLTATGGSQDDWFGASVALGGDTIVVGAAGGEDTVEGSAYVFTKNSGTWSQKAKLTPSNGEANDEFGNSVALGWGHRLGRGVR